MLVFPSGCVDVSDFRVLQSRLINITVADPEKKVRDPSSAKYRRLILQVQISPFILPVVFGSK